jgi:hypothetical protein
MWPERDARLARLVVLEENVNAFIRSVAVAVAFGATVAAASAKTTQSAPDTAKTAQSTAQSVRTAQSGDANGSAAVSAPAGATASSHDQQALSGRRSDSKSDAEAIEQQFRWRVLMPALSGDGG